MTYKKFRNEKVDFFDFFFIWGRGRDPNLSRPGTQGTGRQNRQFFPGPKEMGIKIKNTSRDGDPIFRPVSSPSLGEPLSGIFHKFSKFTQNQSKFIGRRVKLPTQILPTKIFFRLPTKKISLTKITYGNYLRKFYPEKILPTKIYP